MAHDDTDLLHGLDQLCHWVDLSELQHHFHSTCGLLALVITVGLFTLVSMCASRGANYEFDYFFLLDINLVTHLHFYSVFFNYTGSYHFALAS